jgi:hypothetical protein
MDLSDVGSVVAQQMDAIEQDSPDDTEVVASLVCVILHSSSTMEDSSARVRISVPSGHEEPVAKELVRSILQIALERGWI